MARASASTLGQALPGLWHIVRHFWPQIRKQLRLIVLGLVALLADVGIRLLEPLPLKIVIDNVLGNQPLTLPLIGVPDLQQPSLLVGSVVAGVLIAGGRALAAYWSTVGLALAGNRVLTEVRGDLFNHLQRLSLDFHTKARSGDLVVRVISDVGQLRDVVVTAALPLCANILILFGMLGVMLYVNWQLALLALVTAPLFVLSTIRLGKRIKEVARAQRKREGVIAATASESIHAIKVVQALSLEDTFNQAFRNYNQKSLKDGVKGTRLAAKLERTVDVFIALSTALVLWYGAQLVLRGELSTGWLVVFLSYLKNAFKPTRDLAKYAGRLAKASASGERIIDLLQQEPDIRDLPEAVDAPRFRGAVRFENVSFSYEPSQLVLQNVELAVEPAQLVAIVGPSGNGKSTLVSLLLRLYDPQQGGVLIDGRDIRSFTLASLRAQISVVLQENVLFAASVRDNIAYGAPEASDAEIERAARLANAHDFILALPEGYNTVLSERGASLSGGQRQRIAIARAAVRNAPLLVLDELTTGLDEENEQIVVEAIERLARGRTTFAITHNLDMAKRADLVVYLEDRQIVERGTHAELMARDGRYAGLYRLQTAAHAFAAYHEEGHALAS